MNGAECAFPGSSGLPKADVRDGASDRDFQARAGGGVLAMRARNSS